jgi:Alpha-L-arabinofuranosidase B (ABFB) domain
MNFRPLGLAACGLACLLADVPARSMAQREVVALRAFQPANYFVMHQGFTGRADALRSPQDARDTQVRIVQGLADPKCVSFQAVSPPDHYYKHAFWRIVIAKRLDEPKYREDATFCLESGLEKSRQRGSDAISLRSYNFPNRFVRHRDGDLWLDPVEDTKEFRASATFFVVSPTQPGHVAGGRGGAPTAKGDSWNSR